MRIVIIAHALTAGGGVRVGQELIAALQRYATNDDYLITVPEGLDYESYIADRPSTTIYTYKRSFWKLGRWLFDEYRLSTIVNAFKPDVVFALGNRMVSKVKTPQAVLLQDAHFVYRSDHYGHETLLIRIMIELHRRRLKRDLQQVRLMFCQTDVMANRLLQIFGYRGRIAICHNGSEYLTKTAAKKWDFPLEFAHYSDKTRFFCLTRYYPYKNIEVFIDLFRHHQTELRDVVIFITITAEQHPNARRLLRLITKYGLEKHIVNLGPLPRAALESYYRNVHAMILPTLLESYSGTYIEAMQYNCPILTSDFDFARGVCHDAALYFDPRNVGSIKNTIRRFCSNAELQQELKKLGNFRLTENIQDWDSIAAETYKELMSIVPAVGN